MSEEKAPDVERVVTMLKDEKDEKRREEKDRDRHDDRKRGRDDDRRRDERHEEKKREEKKRSEKRYVPQKSACGWVVLVRDVNPDDTENLIRDRFSKFGTVGRIILTSSHRTGEALSALVEFETASDAEAAIKACEGKAGFAFVE
jgi:RNA recognition motif-containing protein